MTLTQHQKSFRHPFRSRSQQLLFALVSICIHSIAGSICLSHSQAASPAEAPNGDERNTQQQSLETGLRAATFDLDVTPPPGFTMYYDPVRRTDELTLRCRGVVFQHASGAVVLAAFDWIGIGNESHDVVRETIAAAAGTDPSRVAVHVLHQHDAPGSDFTAERILLDAGQTDLGRHDGSFLRSLLPKISESVKAATQNTQPVTHIGWGQARVFEVASNRRIPGPDGKVVATRYTATADPALRAEPEGVIDPMVSVVTLWNEDKPVAVLSYYACHPQSYYRTGVPSPDFPGIARFIRQQDVSDCTHIHFNGAGGNIGAGKYNDGQHANRMALAIRLADGMKRAYDTAVRTPVTPHTLSWKTHPVSLPPAAHLNREALEAQVKGNNVAQALAAADKLAWLQRVQSGHQISLCLLSLNDIRILHMPGELFVEYQLAAQAMAPKRYVAMAAYGDYGPGYIGTEIAYEQGGYETSERASDVAPSVEHVLMDGMRTLLADE